MSTIKDLTFKKKIEYIWDYYRWHIIITVAAILIISSTVYSSLHSTKYVFNVSLLGYSNSADSNNITKFQNDVTNLVVDSSKREREEAIVESYGYKNPTDSFENLEPNYVQKFTVKMAAGEIDMLILNSKDFERFKEQGALVKLDDIKDLKTDSLVYGVSAKDSKILKNIGFGTEDKVITIAINSKNKDKAIKVLKWLMER